MRRFGPGVPAVLGLLGALALTVVPVPIQAVAFKPDWVAVLLLYWSVVDPNRFSMLTAFWMGLALDVLTGALLGQNALALIVVVYLAHRFHLRIRAFPISQLVATLTGLLGLYQFLLFWVDGMAGRSVPGIERFGPIGSGAMLLLFAFALQGVSGREARTRLEV
jgi:rod shape-determining protein MreD